MLESANLKSFYSTGRGRNPSDFLFECLKNSSTFDLGLGYFASSGFNLLALGFALFLRNGGTMRFIINDCLVERDREAIVLGQNSLTDEAIEMRLVNDFDEFTKSLSKRNEHFFNCLSWLISSKRLQIIAVVPKHNQVGIVHEKFGIFKDTVGDKVVFNGSMNFSLYALKFNIETIWCEFSWEAQGNAKERLEEMEKIFEETWAGKSDAVRIVQIDQLKTSIQTRFPKKTIQDLIEMELELAHEESETDFLTESYKIKLAEISERLSLEQQKSQAETKSESNKWEHQTKAIALFLERERGILNMATGTGKTRTALGICKKLIEDSEVNTVIITCDGTDLLNQWHKEILKLIQSGPINWIVLRHYETHHESEKFRNNPIRKIMLISRQQLPLVMRSLNPSVAQKTLLVHDEVHRLVSCHTLIDG